MQHGRKTASHDIRIAGIVGGAVVARLRPTQCGDRFEIPYWSLWQNRSTSTGPFGHTVLSIDDALGFIAADELNPQKARILLMLALTRATDPLRIQELYYTY